MHRLLAVLLLSSLPLTSRADSRPLVFTHVTVIDATGAPAKADQTVIVTGDRISAVGPAGKVDIPEGTQVVDGTGKFMIPGLWDMHAHAASDKNFMALFLCNGVTGVRDMHAFSLEEILRARQSVNEGKLLGPRMVVAGVLVDGPKPTWPGSLTAANEAEGRKAVQTLKKSGTDFVKVYSSLPREAYFAIADEAKKEGLPLAGHVPESISAAEASDAGQRSVEHLFGILMACSSKEEELRKEATDALTQSGGTVLFEVLIRSQAKALDTYDEKKAAALFARFVKNRTTQVPTLTVIRALASLQDERFTNDARLKYVHGSIKAGWRKPLRSKDRADLPTEQQRVFKKKLELVKSMHAAGVFVMPGSDTPNPYCFPGFSLHDELEMFVTKCGFTPMEALQTATRNPAEYLDRLKDLGTIEQGKLADLVLLDANPLDDIRNTTKINAVVLNGKLLPRATLQAMLDKVEAECKEKEEAKKPLDSRPILLDVDATQAPRKLLHARLVIPAAPGPLTLYYPKWLQGTHQPSGPINSLSGLTIHARGQRVLWKRDNVDLYAFHCTVPDGADAIELTLDFLGPTEAPMTARLAVINWPLVLLYPKNGLGIKQRVQATLTLPADWKAGTSLPIESANGAVTKFQAVTLETLTDSPVLCGVHLQEVPLGPASGTPHHLVLACDSATGLELGAPLKTQYERLVSEGGALFGARHYRSYRFLLAMSDQISPGGWEHHESSDNRVPERFLVDDSYRKHWASWVPAHEYAHSWNGKYRRPEGLVSADLQQPLETRLLWVYEGLTEYLGFVLAARSGLYAPDVSRDNLAFIAEWVRNQRGRNWRPLEDTATAAPHLYRSGFNWSSRRRWIDFYDEGALLWLDADTLIREKTGGKKSLDDFCRAFFGGKDGSPEVRPYTFDDVVQTLNQVVEHDWKGFLEKRLTSTSPEPPLDGLARAGWKLVYRERPGQVPYHPLVDKALDLTSSIGLLLDSNGAVIDVIPGTAADRAGVGPGMKMLAVNGRRWSAERLRQTVAATAHGGKLSLLLENGDFFETRNVDYAEGEKYPHLERYPGKPDLLADIFRARTGKEAAHKEP